MKTSEKLRVKLIKEFPDILELCRGDLFLLSNKSHVKYGGVPNWISNDPYPVLSYYTMTDCVNAPQLELSECYDNGSYKYIIVPIGLKSKLSNEQKIKAEICDKQLLVNKNNTLKELECGKEYFYIHNVDNEFVRFRGIGSFIHNWDRFTVGTQKLINRGLIFRSRHEATQYLDLILNKEDL